MSVYDLCLSLSLHRFLALQISSADGHKRGSHDVTFFFPGTFFETEISAAVACNPSIPYGHE